MDGYSYDAAGNLLNDGAHNYFYNAENQLMQVDGASGYCNTGTGTAATACYFYDARGSGFVLANPEQKNGRRVYRTKYPSDTCDNDGIREVIYDLSDRPIAEAFNGTSCSFEIYVGGRHLANRGGGTYFSHADWLGTLRLEVPYQYVGNPWYYRYCSGLPFGESLGCQNSSGAANTSATPLHFTGKMRDPETNLDNFGARFDSSSIGRFMSPDPINLTKRRLINPGNTLNKYVYAADNPIKYIDPNGKDITVFYSREGFSHIYLTAFNQATGEVRSLDSNPQIRDTSSDLRTVFGGSSTPNFAPPKDARIVAADGYTSLTIKTTPEEAQKFINLIDQMQKNPSDYNFWSNNCTTACIDALHSLGIDLTRGLLLDDPDDAWDQLFASYANPSIPVFPVGRYPAQPGKEYGFQRFPGINTGQLANIYFRLWQYQNQPLQRACTTIPGPKGPETHCVD